MLIGLNVSVDYYKYGSLHDPNVCDVQVRKADRVTAQYAKPKVPC